MEEAGEEEERAAEEVAAEAPVAAPPPAAAAFGRACSASQLHLTRCRGGRRAGALAVGTRAMT